MDVFYDDTSDGNDDDEQQRKRKLICLQRGVDQRAGAPELRGAGRERRNRLLELRLGVRDGEQRVRVADASACFDKSQKKNSGKVALSFSDVFMTARRDALLADGAPFIQTRETTRAQRRDHH